MGEIMGIGRARGGSGMAAGGAYGLMSSWGPREIGGGNWTIAITRSRHQKGAHSTMVRFGSVGVVHAQLGTCLAHPRAGSAWPALRNSSSRCSHPNRPAQASRKAFGFL